MSEVKEQLLSRVKIKIIPAIFMLAGTGLLATAGFFLFQRQPESSYRPLSPLVAAYDQTPLVNQARKQERQPYVTNEFLVEFAKDVADKDKKNVIKDILDRAPESIFTSFQESTTDVVTAELQLRQSKKKPPLQAAEEKIIKPRRPEAVEIRTISAEPNRKKITESKRYERGGRKQLPPRPKWELVHFDRSADIPRLKQHFSKDERIAKVAENRFYTIQAVGGNDPYLNSSGSWGQPFADLWGLQADTMNTVNAWGTTDGSSDIVIAVSDTGVDYNHPDLAANIWTNIGEVSGNGIDDDSNGYIDDTRGYDFVDCARWDYFGTTCLEPVPEDNDPMDLNGHGTHVAGTVAAVRNNGIGIAGVCPNCTIMPVRGLNAEGSGTTADLVATIYYATDNGADIINMSWGGYGTDAAISTALDYAYAVGVTLVVAAGNSSDDASGFFPANYPAALTVAATTVFEDPAFFSNYGAVIDVAAPGLDILSLRASGTDPYGDGRNFVPRNDPNAQYMRLSGTSMAAPHVAGEVGLLLSRGADRATAETMLRLGAEDVNKARYPDFDIYLGNGRANALLSLENAPQQPGWFASFNSGQSAIRAFSLDTANGVVYVGTESNGIIYRCALTTNCDAESDWTIAFDSPESLVLALTYDAVNQVMYAGTAFRGIIYRCATNTGCDSAAEWTVSYDAAETAIQALGIDTGRNILYAGSNSTGKIYRCVLSTGCDAQADWTVSHDSAATFITDIIYDSVNRALYAASNDSGKIYRCRVTTNCDAPADWTVAYDSSEISINTFEIDSTNGVLYAGSGPNGIAFRCLLATGCDAQAEWSIAYDSAESYIYDLEIDTSRQLLFAGTASNGRIYQCSLSTGCDAPTEWSVDFDATEAAVYTLLFGGGTMYAGTYGGAIYRWSQPAVGEPVISATITAPNEGPEYVARGTSVTVSGSAKGVQFNHYSLDYARAWEEPNWQPISSSSTAVPGTPGADTLGNWNTTGLPAGTYYLRLTVFNSAGDSISEVNTVNYGIEPGWPKVLTAPNSLGDPTLADVDPSVPGKELVAHRENNIEGFHGDGTPITPIPIGVSIPAGAFGNAPWWSSFADFDDDGQMETVYVTAERPTSPPVPASVIIVRRDGSALTGFPAELPALPIYFGCPTPTNGHYDILANATIADLNNDGAQEIIAPVTVSSCTRETVFGRILLYNQSGQALLRPVDEGGYTYQTDTIKNAEYGNPVTVGDLDGDGDLEIVAMDNAGFVRAFHHDGAPVTGWPQWSGGYGEPVVAADLDGDGRDEVITTAQFFWRLDIWRGNGTRFSRSPYGTYGTPRGMIVSDLDDDGVPEVIIRTTYYLNVLRRSGVALERFPIQPTFGPFGGIGWPATAALGNGGALGLVWSDGENNVYQAVNALAERLGPFPFRTMEYGDYIPLLGDVTGDGNLDVVLRGANWQLDQHYYLFSLDVPVGNRSSWPLPYHDAQLTSRFTCPECNAQQTKPYDSQPISCDADPATPSCDRTSTYAAQICGVRYCQADCTCSPHREQARGWPAVTSEIFSHGSVRTADLDADGFQEVIYQNFGQGGQVLRADGSAMPGFPITGDFNLIVDAAAGNVVGDGKLELASAFRYQDTGFAWHTGYSLFDYRGQMLPGWPREVNFNEQTPAGALMADVNPSRPGLEVVGIDRFWGLIDGVFREAAVIHVWDGAGNELPGFPLRLLGSLNSRMAAADIDVDQKAEIVLTLRDENGPRVVAVNNNGSLQWEWRPTGLPNSASGWASSPAIGDISVSRGGRETLIVIDTWDAGTSRTTSSLFVLSNTGQVLPGWPATIIDQPMVSGFVSPILAEVDGDNRLEIILESIAGPETEIFVYEDSGILKPGWPVPANYYDYTPSAATVPEECQPTAADMDGDRNAEIILCGWGGKIRVLQENGSDLAGWPLNTGAELSDVPAYVDLDRDGKGEMMVKPYLLPFILAFKTPHTFFARSGDWRSAHYDATLNRTSAFVPATGGGGGGGGSKLCEETPGSPPCPLVTQ